MTMFVVVQLFESSGRPEGELEYKHHCCPRVALRRDSALWCCEFPSSRNRRLKSVQLRWPSSTSARVSFSQSQVITFDRGGVSDHPNHKALFCGVQLLIFTRMLPACKLYSFSNAWLNFRALGLKVLRFRMNCSLFDTRSLVQRIGAKFYPGCSPIQLSRKGRKTSRFLLTPRHTLYVSTVRQVYTITCAVSWNRFKFRQSIQTFSFTISFQSTTKQTLRRS